MRDARVVHPAGAGTTSKKLEKIWTDLGESGGRLPADEVCPTYLILAEAAGGVRNGDTVFYSTLGSMTAACALSCEDGNMILAGYGEYGIGPSIALQNGVLRLLDAAKERSAGIFEEVGTEEGADDDPDATDSASPTPGPDDEDADEDASPSPEPSPTETDEDDSDS